MGAESSELTSTESVRTDNLVDLDLDSDDDQDLALRHPRFPPELEFEIFTLTFSVCQETPGKDQTNLLCVASRVRDWLIPLIWDILVLDSHYYPNPPLSGIQRYGHHVHRILVLRPTPIKGSDILQYCPNIWDLGFWQGVSLDAGIFGLGNLKRLTLKDLHFFGLPATEQRGISSAVSGGMDDEAEETKKSFPSGQAGASTIPINFQRDSMWFQNITHMILVSEIPAISSCTPLLEFSNLTHLMLLSSNSTEILRHILQSHTKLEVVVWLLDEIECDDGIDVVAMNSVVAPSTDDERVVTIDCNFSAEWIRAAKGQTKEDIWRVAERTVERRRRMHST